MWSARVIRTLITSPRRSLLLARYAVKRSSLAPVPTSRLLFFLRAAATAAADLDDGPHRHVADNEEGDPRVGGVFEELAFDGAGDPQIWKLVPVAVLVDVVAANIRGAGMNRGVAVVAVEDVARRAPRRVPVAVSVRVRVRREDSVRAPYGAVGVGGDQPVMVGRHRSQSSDRRRDGDRVGARSHRLVLRRGAVISREPVLEVGGGIGAARVDLTGQRRRRL